MQTLLFLVVAALLSSCSPQAKRDARLSEEVPAFAERLPGNTWIHRTSRDFAKGAQVDTVVTEAGNGGVTLANKAGVYVSQGVYESPIHVVPSFNHLVLSWNADTPRGTSIKVEGQVYREGQWTAWLSWGSWSTFAGRASESPASEDVAIHTDTLQTQRPADAFRYRLTLMTSQSGEAPKVNLVAATISRDGGTIPKGSDDAINSDQLANSDIAIELPPFSQTVRDPQFADLICSPTSMSMLLNRKGETLVPEQSAMGIYDLNANITGNWSFNAAFAGSLGYESHIEFMNSLDDLKREILKGHPLAISVQYRRDESVEGTFPVIHGAPIPSTPGHILVVSGFRKGDDGREVAVVYDPAAAVDSEVRRSYLATELDAAWATSGRVTYLVHDKVPGDGIAAAKVEHATMTPTGATRVVDGRTYREYQIVANGQAIDLSRNADLSKQAGVSIMATGKDGVRRYLAPSLDQNAWVDDALAGGTYTIRIHKSNGESYASELNK